MNPIFLDYNSTTPVDEEVLESMLPFFRSHFGNAASHSHHFGWAAAEAVERARAQVAQSIGAEESEIIFTSGSTEAINLAIKGVCESYASKGSHIILYSTEHKAVLDVGEYLKNKSIEVSVLPVLSDGTIDLDQLKKTIRPDTILVCVMMANNETGVLMPVKEVADIVHQSGALLFSDATQAMGKIKVNINECGADLLCLSSHKIYGPKGAGALYKSRKNPRVHLTAQIHGGGHENNLRSGTLNVPAIVGFGKACELADKNVWEYARHTSFLRTLLEQELSSKHQIHINGTMRARLPNTSNICFPNKPAENVIKALHPIAVSSGSACSSALPEPSHVLTAMGLTKEDALNSVRFSLGKNTSEEEIRIVTNRINEFLTIEIS